MGPTRVREENLDTLLPQISKVTDTHRLLPPERFGLSPPSMGFDRAAGRRGIRGAFGGYKVKAVKEQHVCHVLGFLYPWFKVQDLQSQLLSVGHGMELVMDLSDDAVQDMATLILDLV